MSRVPGILAIVLALLYGALPARAAQDTALERGTAITDPATLRELDGGKFRLDRMLHPDGSADILRPNSALFCRRCVVTVLRDIASKGWPARLDRPREYRPHRNQSADCARAEIFGPRFPHRLSAEGLSLRSGRARLRGIPDGKPD